ncbi:hypothetical protein [Chondromyces crocatus]|nr:hypothetical protein [Chondromyces crocatus]
MAGKSDSEIEARQSRISESEFAHRLRARFIDLDTFLNAQGKSSERDIVSDTFRLEIEIQYLADRSSQGEDVPMGDWQWLIGSNPRLPARDFVRLWWLILPRVGYGFGSTGAGKGAAKETGRWNVQDCLSFTPRSDTVHLPYIPIVEAVWPRGRRNDVPSPALKFCRSPMRETILETELNGNLVLVRADVLGDPYNDSVWGMFYAPVTEDEANALPHHVRLR